MDTHQQKSELRAQFKTKRKALSNKPKISKQIIKKCIAYIGWESANTLHTYIGSGNSGEVNTQLLLEYIWHKHPNVQTFVPVVVNGEIQSIEANPKTKWQTNKWGFLEPSSRSFVSDSKKFDIIIVPTLAFDKHGYRLGHGSGHYDKFLAKQTSSTKIGLAYAETEVDHLPNENHDIPLQTIITQDEIIQTQG